MNTTIYKLFVVLFLAVTMTACVDDLNTRPIDKNSNTSFNQSQMFTKCYSCLITTGQKLQDDPDVEDINEGFSSFYRSSYFMNELPSDETWWNWQDPGVIDLCLGNWTGINEMVQCIYARLNINIKYYNHFIRYADTSTPEGWAEVAEVRFLRALHYYYLMDFFLYVPFAIEESTDYPNFIPRYDLYDWLVNKELPDVISMLPEKRVNMWRVDKAAAYLLLSRCCLNAAVYNKYNTKWTPADSQRAWKSAYDNANLVVNTGANYGLYTQSDDASKTGMKYSAFQKIFMADNDKNGAIEKEGILALYQDGIYCRSWGGATLLVLGPRKVGMGACGITTTDPWKSLRTSPTLPRKFYSLLGKNDADAAQNGLYDEYAMPAYLKDDRGIFCSYNDTTYGKIAHTWLLQGCQRVQSDDYFYDCWAGCKYTNVYSTSEHPSKSVGNDKNFPDVDIVLMRAAEAYLNMAEAEYRLHGATQIVVDNINQLRRRANANECTIADISDSYILDEWSREFWFEGRRRTDLIRFNRFYGADSDQNQYNWEGRAAKNDDNNGGKFAAGTPDYLNWFPVPTKDKNANPNFKKQVMEDKSNIFASQGGDGYPL